MPETKPDLDKIVITMKWSKATERTNMFTEELGEQEWSDQGVAMGNLYLKTQALELIGMPKHIKVTVEPIPE